MEFSVSTASETLAAAAAAAEVDAPRAAAAAHAGEAPAPALGAQAGAGAVPYPDPDPALGVVPALAAAAAVGAAVPAPAVVGGAASMRVDPAPASVAGAAGLVPVPAAETSGGAMRPQHVDAGLELDGDEEEEEEGGDKLALEKANAQYVKHLDYMLSSAQGGGLNRVRRRVVIAQNELIYTRDTASKPIGERVLLPSRFRRHFDFILLIEPSGNVKSPEEQNFHNKLFYASGFNVDQSGGGLAVRDLVRAHLRGDRFGAGLEEELEAILLEAKSVTSEGKEEIRSIFRRRQRDRLVRCSIYHLRCYKYPLFYLSFLRSLLWCDHLSFSSSPSLHSER